MVTVIIEQWRVFATMKIYRKVRNYDQYSHQIIEESTKSSHIYPKYPNPPSRSLSLREDSVFLPKAPNPIPENNIKPVFFAFYLFHPRPSTSPQSASH
ncbi:hypothetical protein ACN38_g5034 [Penicillium nordicum]|uniref:Uncharacterized protein n=1 Tax=Penicillium nordicum TaxID=229535 RepID=A0A0M8P2E4_9EURO|nr:hypothetical protein ACN38_g5034 [Penicillium nordicum]